MKNVGYWPEDS
jgi:hypothetical protein